ncbi:MAG TPA: DoxX family protein [Chitinophagaceae bacterium]|nr:DoxX family protein [Chitinophagaceae bacterium]
MKPKTINLLYWIFTFLFAGLMAFSAIPNLLTNEDSVKFMHDLLGYPVYIIPFIGAAKLLGVIAILIPGLKKIKEWAYAGLFFDLAGAIYSNIAVAKGVDPMMFTMLVWIVPGILSYIFWHKKINRR